MHFRVGEASPARKLFQLAVFAHEREFVVVVLSVLYFQVFEMYASSVDAHWCTGFHPSILYAMLCDGLCQMIRSRFCDSPSVEFGVSDVHQPVQERACGEDDAPGFDFDVEIGLYSCGLFVFHD